MTKNARYWIARLNLVEHPEGGYFAPAFRSSERVGRESLPDRFTGERAVVSSIYYLLEAGQFSTFHRMKSVEIWNFYEGSPLAIHILTPEGTLFERRLGRDIEKGEVPQLAIEPGNWFAAELCGPDEFALTGCVVAPGFEYEDMELAARPDLLALYPEHGELISRLTRE